MREPTKYDSGATWEAWLHDRLAHRQPVDAHFAQAIEWIDQRARDWQAFSIGASPAQVYVLELGPGPELDLRRAVLQIAGAEWYGADVGGRGAQVEGMTDIGEQWEREHRLPFGTAEMTAVLAREVFEHIFEYEAMLDECRRILVPGGRLWFSTPLNFPLHDYDTGDYWRHTGGAWEKLLDRAGFTRHEVNHARLLFGGWQLPVSVLGWAEV